MTFFTYSKNEKKNYLSLELDSLSNSADSHTVNSADSHTIRIWSETIDNSEYEHSPMTTFISSKHSSLEERVGELLGNQVTVVIVNEKGQQTVIEPIAATTTDQPKQDVKKRSLPILASMSMPEVESKTENSLPDDKTITL
jgi:hypothetical protein